MPEPTGTRDCPWPDFPPLFKASAGSHHDILSPSKLLCSRTVLIGPYLHLYVYTRIRNPEGLYPGLGITYQCNLLHYCNYSASRTGFKIPGKKPERVA